MKFCTYCNVDSAEDHWGTLHGRPNPACKQRNRDNHARYMKSGGRLKNIKRTRDRVKQTREEFNALKRTLKCERCPENHISCLEFHHIDSAQKDNTVSYFIAGGMWKQFLKEAKKCIVLCSNCHRKHHYEERQNQ